MILRLAKRVALALFAVASAPALSLAHVGSPDVVFDGKAGPYDIRVIVRVPRVVPGLADVNVRILHGKATTVRIRPVFWRTGVSGSPSADVAKPVEGARGLFAGQLWLMARGAYSVYVTVDGAEGSGTATVPVMSIATGRLGMSAGLSVILVALGILLVAGLITIVYVAAGESVVEPGRSIPPAGRKRARLIGVIAIPVITIILFGGARWWQVVDASYQQRMYRPFVAKAAVLREAGKPVLHLAAALDPLLPDHGKLMHLFVIDSARMTSFAHLHPSLVDSSTFSTMLPPLPPGSYRLYGDVTFETGQTQTILGTVRLTTDDSVAAAAIARSDPDDSWRVSEGVTRRPDVPTMARLEDGSTMEWLADSTRLRAGEDATFRFRVRDPSGAPAALETYLGMAAHAVIARIDGSVFVHLHPAGTVSMAAQEAFALRDRGDTTPTGHLRLPDDTMTPHLMPLSAEISFPYVFPRPGSYRVWVQVRRAGRVLTGVFDCSVSS
ncbi:MAG TPA: hypothetical protein VJW73_03785 [Gemmatimonadaceae bacterium]|nr:hypothetical protein [Gemmatimonadaceae bacterium]